jgi:hypothetical protein
LKKIDRTLLIVGFILAAFVLASCATNGAIPSTKPDALKNPFVVQSYKTLFTIAQTYNAAWLTFRDLHTAKIISDADFEAGKAIARQYRTAHQDAVDALIKMEKGEYGQNQTEIMLSLATTANKQILAFLGPRIQKK